MAVGLEQTRGDGEQMAGLLLPAAQCSSCFGDGHLQLSPRKITWGFVKTNKIKD